LEVTKRTSRMTSYMALSGSFFRRVSLWLLHIAGIMWRLATAFESFVEGDIAEEFSREGR
jgi:hypothetical protein